MKTLALIVLIYFAAAWLISCSNTPQEIKKTSNSDYKVALLFEVDGCKVYRFSEGQDNEHYFSNCGEVK